MNRIKLVLLATTMAVTACLSLTGCVVVPAHPYYGRAWVPGYWASTHVWVEGHWRYR
jgi:hypothetical protein